MSSSRPLRDTTPEPNPQVAPALPVLDTPNSQRISVQLEHSVNHDGRVQPANKRNVEEVEERIHTDLLKATMKDVVGLVERVFHDLLLPVKPEQVISKESLRLNNEWTAWPRKKRTISESDLAVFINLIGNVAKAICKIEPLYCSDMFEDYAVPDPTGESAYKPDLVFFKAFVDMAERDLMRWMVIWMTLEIKAAKEKKSEAYKQSARYAQCIFNSQPGRRFVPAVFIVGPMVTLVIFDRSGPVRGEAFNIHQNPEKFLRIILGILFVAPEHLGFDVRFYLKPGGDEKYITVKGVEYKVDCIYREPGIKGRGTVCYHGVDQRDNSDVVIKDAWVDVARQETEVSILEFLNKDDEASLCNSSGARVIPKIVAHEFCTTKRPVLIDGEERLEDVKDTTAIFRESRLQIEGGEPKWAWSKNDKETAKKVEIRVHCRIVMTPYGKKLETFPSLKVLMRGLGDIVLAIKILQRKRIIHRDVSFRNILLHQHGGALHGLLIDYDYAISIDRVSSEAIGERTGTLPFMAIGRLQDTPTTPHRYFHDLESMFYVLCWLCTVYAGPLSQKRVFSRSGLAYHNTTVAMWNGDTPGKMSMKIIYNSKKVSIGKKDFEDLLKEFADYFKDIIGCFRSLRHLLFRPSPDDEDDYVEKKARLDKRFDSAAAVELEEMKWEYNEIPITMRPPEIVLESFKISFNDAMELLPEENPTAVVADEVKEGTELTDANPRKVRDLVDNVVPRAAADLESEDESESDPESDHDSDESYVETGVVSTVSAGSPRCTRSSSKRKPTGEPGGTPSSPKRSRTPVVSGGIRQQLQENSDSNSSDKKRQVFSRPRRSGRTTPRTKSNRSEGPGPSNLGSQSYTASDIGDDPVEEDEDSQSDSST